MIESIYHEKQMKELCALHALNNLFQRQMFAKSELDKICENLTPNRWINPHRSMLGLGNYDINVILTALQQKGWHGIWFDKRKDPDSLCVENIFGFILNIPNEYKFGMITIPIHRRHWIALKQVNNKYYNLDSKIDSPHLIGDRGKFIEYLKSELQSNDKELFIIVDSKVEKDQTWISTTTEEQS